MECFAAHLQVGGSLGCVNRKCIENVLAVISTFYHFFYSTNFVLIMIGLALLVFSVRFAGLLPCFLFLSIYLSLSSLPGLHHDNLAFSHSLQISSGDAGCV